MSIDQTVFPSCLSVLLTPSSFKHTKQTKLDFTARQAQRKALGSAAANDVFNAETSSLNDDKRALLHQGKLKLWVEGRIWHSLQLREALLFTDMLVLAMPPSSNAAGAKAEVDAIISLATCKMREIGKCDLMDTKPEVIIMQMFLLLIPFSPF